MSRHERVREVVKRSTELSVGPVLLRPPRRRDAKAWSEIRLRNEAWLAQWEPTSNLSWQERNQPVVWRSSCAALRRGARAGTTLPFAICYGGRFVGQINVSNIVWGAQRGCFVGYWVDSAVAGRSIVPTALALVIDHCLTTIGLHRVEVDIRPENRQSLRVVEKLGLRCEGERPRYLDIGGDWRDHVTFAVTAEELVAGPMLSRLTTLPRPPG